MQKFLKWQESKRFGERKICFQSKTAINNIYPKAQNLNYVNGELDTVGV